MDGPISLYTGHYYKYWKSVTCKDKGSSCPSFHWLRMMGEEGIPKLSPYQKK